jgi:hypothetical protein
MAVSIVARGAVGLRKEASFGSGGGIDSWQVVESSRFNASNIYAYNDRIRATPEQTGGRFVHSLLTGSVTFPVSPQNPTQWWEAGIGGTGPYTPQIPLSSLAIEAQEGDLAAVYSSGDMVGRIEFSSKQGDYLRCTVALEGKDMDARVPASTIPSGAFPSGDDPYRHEECTFTLDGVVNTAVVSFSVAKENNLVTDLFGNLRTRRDILATKAFVSGSIGILFETTTFRDRFMNNKISAVTANYVRGSKSFKIELLNINYDSSDRPMESQTSYVMETLNFTAFVDDASVQNSMKVTVV